MEAKKGRKDAAKAALKASLATGLKLREVDPSLVELVRELDRAEVAKSPDAGAVTERAAFLPREASLFPVDRFGDPDPKAKKPPPPRRPRALPLLMRVLVIGGNRFLGVELTAQLLLQRHQVTLLNRGHLVDPFGARVQRLLVDRASDGFDAALAGTSWDAVIDFALFDGPQAARLLRVLEGRVGHLVAISTGQVYLVRTPRPEIATEADFEGPVQSAPPSPSEEPDWRYGVEKRDAERALAASSMPFTTLRLPMVHGGRDPKRRIDSLLWRMMDGGPILLTQPEAPVRHVFSGAVVRAVLSALSRGPTRRAFNLGWSEALTARTFVEQVGRAFGVSPRVEVRSWEALTSAGLDPVQACTVNSRWMSALDASLAQQALGFVHEPLDAWLPRVVHALVSGWTGQPPSVDQRPGELRLLAGG